MSWNGDADLDSCLFTPHKAESGDMARINAVNSTDDYGNILTADSKDGQTAEVITIANRINGTYKYYVSDYNNCLNGNYTATDMLTYDIRVTVYDKNGIVVVYTIPRNLRGVIWEVFEIKNGKVVTLQNSYANLDGKNWWSEDKSLVEKNREARKAFYDVMVNGVMPIGDFDKYVLDICRQDGVFMLRDIDQDGIDEMLFPASRESLEEFENINSYGEGDLTSKIILILKYSELGTEVIFTDINDWSCGEILLNDNKILGTYWGSYDEHLGWEYYIRDSWNEFLQPGEDSPRISYRYLNYSEENTEYFTNDQIVSKEEWRAGIQKDILDNLIPQDQLYDVSVENFQKVLLR